MKRETHTDRNKEGEKETEVNEENEREREKERNRDRQTDRKREGRWFNGGIIHICRYASSSASMVCALM